MDLTKPVYDPPFGSYNLEQKKEHHLAEFSEHTEMAKIFRELADAHEKVAKEHQRKLEQMDVLVAA